MQYVHRQLLEMINSIFTIGVRSYKERTQNKAQNITHAKYQNADALRMYFCSGITGAKNKTNYLCLSFVI